MDYNSIGLSVGILFLAGGGASLRRDPTSIGAMVISFCPKFPMRTVDNQYHLQALRHLYVLAVEWRSMVTVDISSNLSVSSQVTLHRPVSGEFTMLSTPCLLPELSSFEQILIDDGRFCEYKTSRTRLTSSAVQARRDNISRSAHTVIYVKKKTLPTGIRQICEGSSMILISCENALHVRCIMAIRKNLPSMSAMPRIDMHGIVTARTSEVSSMQQLSDYIFEGILPIDRESRKQLSFLLTIFAILPHHRWHSVDQTALLSIFQTASSIHELGGRLSLLSLLPSSSQA